MNNNTQPETAAPEPESAQGDYTATYSPEDNKLRLYAVSRLDKETFARVKAAGFRWAPKQELFVAPMWTPSREDLLIELAGEIGDEDTSLVERQEQRAERFEDYSASRSDDADRAHKGVSAIADNIPLGQPILVGHHSEKRARKDAERIENGMRRAVKMWEQSKYWTERAAGAIRHAKYKELPSVRARRIKRLEADKRKQERCNAQAARNLRIWEACKNIEGARLIYSRSDAGWLTTAKHPTLDQYLHAWDVLQPMEERDEYDKKYPLWTLDQVKERARVAYGNTTRADRWIAHYDNRLAYERAMLEESGGTVADRKGPEKGGACKCWASHRGGWSYIQKVNQVSVTVLDNWGNGGANFTRTIPFDKLGGIMTAAEVQEARDTEQLIESGDKTGFFLRGSVTGQAANKPEPKPEAAKFDALKETLRAGVQVAVAPQLFPTPPALAKSLVTMADIREGDRVLEPSAGTGNIIREIPDFANVHALEINLDLARNLANTFQDREKVRIDEADFLQCAGAFPKFDKIIMNPPFENGADIKHILHARTLLKPGGKLVALCANGPRQQAQLKPLAEYWEPLPADTFKESGTGVNTAIVILAG